jgi:hypothetical protein
LRLVGHLSLPCLEANNNNNRSVLHIFITAATTLLTHTISNSSEPLAQADLKLLEPLLNILGMLARSGGNNKVGEMYQSCMDLYGKARSAVEKYNTGGGSWDPENVGCTPGQKESIDEFLQRMENIKCGYEDSLNMAYPGVLDDVEESIN